MKLQFTLIENAKDSLAHAVDHLTQAKPTTGDYKRAILDLSHATELLLKETDGFTLLSFGEMSISTNLLRLIQLVPKKRSKG